MQLEVRTLVGQAITVEVEADDKVETIKEKLEEKGGIPPGQQRLIFNGKQIKDQDTVQQAGLTDGSRLHLALHLRGGA